jgi:FlgD Ig-like domain
MRRFMLILSVLLTIAASSGSSPAAAFEGVLRVSPVGDYTCVAVELDISAHTAVTGVQWLNNDENVVFPELIVLEASPGEAPDLANAGLVLYQAVGPSLAWGSVDFGTPIYSSTGRIYVVFVLPAQSQTDATGVGGGPGIGMENGGGNPFYISAEGLSWVPFDRDHGLSVSAIPLQGLQKGASLAKLSDMDPGNWQPPRAKVPKIPDRAFVRPPYPNPFNPRTEIAFGLTQPGKLSVRVYSLRGQLVRTLVDRAYPAGFHSIPWLGKDGTGNRVASGVYLVKITGPGLDTTHRVALLK